ncbi:MAG: hypothetical protein IJ706_02950 [Clostridia bacterium]|nr:hypothetical protein [Clostridia bacterium]
MNRTKSNKIRSIMIAFALMLFTSIFASAVPYKVKADGELTGEEIANHVILINFEQRTYDALQVNYYLPDEYYSENFTYKAATFMTRLIEERDITGYLEDNITGVTDLSPSMSQCESGKIFKVLLNRVASKTENISFVFAVKDSGGNYYYTEEKHALYTECDTINHTNEELEQMALNTLKAGSASEEMNKSFSEITTNLGTLIDSFWIYIVIGCSAVVVVWGAYIGIKIAIAHKNEEKINAREMIKNLVVGIVIMFVLALGGPLLIKGLSAWVG